MGSNTSVYSLEQICLGIFDCPHSTPTLSDSGPYMVRTQDIRQGFFETSTAVRVSEEVYAERTKRVVPTFGDLLFSREGTYFGDAAEVPRSTRVCLGQRMVLIRPNTDLIRPSYLRIQINSPAFQAVLKQYRDGTVAERLNLPVIRSLKIQVPSFRIQDFVIENTTQLERKIELNRQINTTLEAMAQALFKSWFVDFDPVIDNALASGHPIPDELADRAERRQQLHASRSAETQPLPAAIQQQFPDRFVFTEEMGWVPEGWKAAPISELAKLNPETWTPKNHPDVLHYVDLSNAKSGRINETIAYKFSEAPSRARRVLRKDDSIIGTVRPGNRSFAFIHYDGLTGSTGFAVMRPRQAIFRSYTYLALTRDEVIEMFAHLADGGAYPAIRPDVVASQYVVIPSDALLSEFDQRVYPWLTRIGAAETMNEALAKTRDTLLPKLLSGQLRIPEAEQQVAEAL